MIFRFINHTSILKLKINIFMFNKRALIYEQFLNKKANL